MGKKNKKDYNLLEMQTKMMSNIIEQDVCEYNKENMAIFGANINLQRHINEIRDGLKPVHRRLLMAMYGLKLFPNKPFTKCSSIIGETMKKFH